MSLWPYTDTLANLRLAYNLTVMVHTAANFTTDASTVVCASRLDLVHAAETFVACPATSNVRYVSAELAQWACWLPACRMSTTVALPMFNATHSYAPCQARPGPACTTGA